MHRALPDGFELDDDPSRVDIEAVHAFISGESYWGRGRTIELTRATITGSTRVLGLYRDGEQLGFARAVSDAVTVAYLADVYVLRAHRGRGLGVALVSEMVDGAFGRRVRWLLHTADAEGLYAKLGFGEDPPTYPLMERAAAAGRSPSQ